MEALWADLEKDDANATRVLLKLSAMPKATAFLGQKLKPLKIDAEQVTALFALKIVGLFEVAPKSASVTIGGLAG